MKIDSIDVINLRFEYPNLHGFQSAGGITGSRLTTLVLVHTDTGATGVGSVYSHPGVVYLTIKGQLEPLLRGQDPREVESLWEKMYKWTRWYGRKGAAVSAIGGLDIAFWDLRGQSLQRPLWSVFGGEKGQCPAYASALLWNTPSGLAAEAQKHLSRGFRRMKMRLGKSEEYDIAAVNAVRQAIGPDHDLMCDASMRYHLELARRIGRHLAEQRVFWFEEPFAPEDLEAYSALRGTIGVSVAAGENEFGRQGFAELIQRRAVDIVQADASRCGGITEVRRVAELAGQAGLRVAPHTWSDAVAVTANAHVVTSIPHGLTVEVDQTGNPFIEELLVEPIRVTDGILQLSDRPGLGIQLNWNTIDRLRMKDPLQIPDGCYSDMLFGPEWFRPFGPYVES